MNHDVSFPAFADALPEPMFLLNVRGQVLACNRSGREFLGHFESSPSWEMASLICDLPSKFLDYLRMCSRSRTLLVGAFVFRQAQNGAVRLRCEAGRYADDGTLIFRALSQEQAISRFSTLNTKLDELARENRERRRAEAQVRVLNSQLHAVIQASPVGIIFFDPNQRVRLINAAAENILGWSFRDIVDQRIPIHDGDPDVWQNKVAGAMSENTRTSLETRHVRADGREIDVAVSAASVRDAAGDVTGYVVLMADISERKQAEAALLKSEKLAAAGRLAASIAHEINNPLEAITNLAYLMQYDASLSSETRKLLSTMMSELRRVEGVVKQTLGFYRETARPMPIRVSELVDSVITVLSAKLEMKRVRLSKRFDDDYEVEGYAGEIRQVIANLLVNAIDAVPTNGIIRVSVSSEDGGVCVAIEDNGNGIPENYRARLFEPFFTTKSDKGTGLGLWVVQEIVNRHGGNIQLESSTDPARHGTMFSIFLPRTFRGAYEQARATLAS